MLPSHRIPPPIQPPLVYEGCSIYELACWHRHHYDKGETDRCRAIERVVNSLCSRDRRDIKQLNYYIPLAQRTLKQTA